MSDSKMCFHVDPDRKLLRVTTSGFWTVEDVHEYDRLQRAAMAELAAHGCAHDDVLYLIDTRGQGPQSAEVINEMTAVFADPIHALKRVAMLTSSTLLARQTHRTKAYEGHFSDEAEALAWLMALEPVGR